MFEYGMSDKDPVTLALSDVRLDAALNIILGQLNLTYLVEDGVLKVTPAQTAIDRVQTKVYDPPIAVSSNYGESDGLIAIIKAIDPYRGEDSHAVCFVAGKLVIVADYQTHRKVRDLFTQLKASGVTNTPSIGWGNPGISAPQYPSPTIGAAPMIHSTSPAPQFSPTIPGSRYEPPK